MGLDHSDEDLTDKGFDVKKSRRFTKLNASLSKVFTGLARRLGMVDSDISALSAGLSKAKVTVVQGIEILYHMFTLPWRMFKQAMRNSVLNAGEILAEAAALVQGQGKLGRVLQSAWTFV